MRFLRIGFLRGFWIGQKYDLVLRFPAGCVTMIVTDLERCEDGYGRSR